MDKRLERMKELTALLTDASRAYYRENREVMSNFAYDKLYDELQKLEAESGVVLAGSPTTKVGYEVLEELPKERHEAPMLSLDKTKEVAELAAFAGTHKTLVSWKLDGLTVVLTYREGKLFKAVTRGNGEIGEVITNNARVFENVPLSIPFQGELILRGEAVISYKDFEKINEEIADIDAKYKNPRNLCSGSVRQLSNEITARRHVRFFAFALVRAEGEDFENSAWNQFEWLKGQGFDVVEHKIATRDTMEGVVQEFAQEIADYPIPSDGLVALYDDIAYGQSLGTTAKFPRNAYAFKWRDEIKETHLLEIEWSPSRTGLINPVAIFEPVELEGTTVTRASVHNISILEALKLGEGDVISVYKANMIIPQIAENLTKSGTVEIPKTCPVCGGVTKIQKMNDAKMLFCTNPDCLAKKIKSFTLFVSRDAMNIEGLSEATLEKMIGKGFIHEFADIYHLDRHAEEIMEMDGFGQKSYENLADSIKRSRHTTLPRFVYGLGIPNVGVSNAKVLCAAFSYELSKLMEADAETIAATDGIGPVIGESVATFFQNEQNRQRVDHLLQELEVEKPEVSAEEQIFAGKTFVITGSLTHFSNRKELQARIEALGGKATGSVSAKTDYLINNDVTSGSSKNKKARELGIPILSEEDFLRMTEGK